MRIAEVGAVRSPFPVFCAILRVQSKTEYKQQPSRRAFHARRICQQMISVKFRNAVDYFAEQGVGFQPFPLGSFLKSELVRSGRVK